MVSAVLVAGISITILTPQVQETVDIEPIFKDYIHEASEVEKAGG